MPPSRVRENKPTFLWQGILILLPTLVLVCLAAAFLYRDHARAEQEAKARAAEIARQLAEALPEVMATWLSEYEANGFAWSSYQRDGLAAWPGSRDHERHSTNRQWIEVRLERYTNLLHDRRWPTVWPVNLTFSGVGELTWPPDYSPAPQPPAWLHNIPTEFAQMWAVARLAGSSEKDATKAREACHVLTGTNVPNDLRANARLLAAMSEAGTNQQAGRAALLECAKRAGDALTESGLPVGTIAVAHVLRDAEKLDEELFAAVKRELSRPSIFTARLLSEAERLAASGPDALRAVTALREVWESDERRRAIGRAIQKQGAVRSGPATTNLWVDVSVDGETSRWFVILDPSPRFITTSFNGRTSTSTNLGTAARVFPQKVIQRAFRESIGSSKVNLPPYLGIELQLEGEEIPPEGGGGSAHLTSMNGPLLSEAQGSLKLTGVHQPSGKHFESLPSHPAFRVRLYLADPVLLHADERQRMFWLGGILAAAAAAALAGFVTAYRAFHRQLRLAEMKSDFVSSVSHELRAPIASVRLMAEGLDRGKINDPARQRDYFRFIVQECRRLSTLVENVLDFARIDQGRKQYELDTADLAAVAEQTVAVMQPYACERGVTLTYKGISTCSACIDPHAIQQALVNLIDNAVKHSAAGEEVTVDLTTTAREALITVADHGPGIPAKEHRKIFERFYRLGSELRRETTGVGIGLSIVQHIAEAHHGEVRLESDPGKGSRFTLVLPLGSTTPAQVHEEAVHGQ